MTDKTADPCGSDSSTELSTEAVVWVRHNGKPHTSGIAHFGGECPPGWVGGARPFFSAEYLAEAVRRETEKLTKALRQHVLTYQVDDQEWDREKAADRAVARMLNTKASG
jgi:hypothetical protein